MGNLSIKKTEEREDLWRRLLEATGESTVAGALDVAAKHYLADLRSKDQLVEDLDDEILQDLSNPWLPLERDVSTSVGRAD